MLSERRGRLLARVFLTVGALLPYWRFLTLQVVYVTDDYFASDIFNGELPGRVLVGQLLRRGQAPVWTTQLCSGLPLVGAPADPISLALFTLLPTAAALDLLVIILLLVAAHGAYNLARRFHADRTGAVLAGLAFAGSGYLACQLKHLAIISTVVWLPVGLDLLDRAFDADVERVSWRRRSLFLALFGMVFGEQALSGFPQSAYIVALVYGSFALFRLIQRRHAFGLAGLARLGGWFASASVLGAATGALVLLPLARLGAVSDRAEPLGYRWSTRLAYWPQNVWTLFVPYIHGNIADNSYTGPPFFWEDYGYVGLATILLAGYAAFRERRRPEVLYAIALTLLAYLLVLGQATPVFYLAYLAVPGMAQFRFPTRFLIVVELGLAILGAIGLTRLRETLAARMGAASRVPAIVAIAICVATSLDLFVHQPSQNPTVPAETWLAPPGTVRAVHAGPDSPRTFTPRHRDLHRRTFQQALGWADVRPYYAVRDLLEPNLGGALWNTPSADCYAGISARWYVDVWGDHNREASLMSLLSVLDFNTSALRLHPLVATALKTFGVTHVLSPLPEQDPVLPFAERVGMAYIYTVPGAARARVVRGAKVVHDDKEAAREFLSGRFDPDREVLLHDAPADVQPAVSVTSSAGGPYGRANVTSEDSRDVIVSADAPAAAFLLLADTYYPGWTATVDGSPAPLYRADFSIRAVPIGAGHHEVRFHYDPPGFAVGLSISLAAAAVLVMWAAAAAVMARRARRY